MMHVDTIWQTGGETLRRLAREVKQENYNYGRELEALPRVQWEAQAQRSRRPLLGMWRSRDFLVQMYDHGEVVRLSVNRTVVDVTNRRWRDGITWDELQDVKRQIGLGGHAAIEFFPPDKDVVNVSNMRHLWVFKEGCPLAFMWREGEVPT